MHPSVHASGPNRVRPRDFLFFHIGLWYLGYRCITMRWCVVYQYCLCATLTFDLRLNYWLWRIIFVSAPEMFYIFSHRVMTFGMYVHFQETMCRISILKIVHSYHTSIFPVLPVHKFHLHMTHWQGPHEMTPISMVSSYSVNDELSKIEFSHYKILISVQ